MFIDGAWTDADPAGGDLRPTFAVTNPATGEPIAAVPIATTEELNRAVAAAAAAGAAWANRSGWQRGVVLDAIADTISADLDRLARLLSDEQGKPLAQALGEVAASAESFAWFAEEARRLSGRIVDGRTGDRRFLITREAAGPVAAFTPSNFPWLLPARKIAAALAAGCSVIHKPAEETPLSALAMAEIAFLAGLPAGVLNVVTGDPAHISEVLLGADQIRVVSLTGSVAVGKALLRRSAETVKRVFMELGGHAPVIVLADADVDAAATDLVSAKFRNCGQVCVAPSRVYVPAEVADRFAAAVVDATRRLLVGPATDPAVDVGPLVSPRRRQAVEAMVEDARAKGATILIGGRTMTEQDPGYFYEPTVLAGVTVDMSVLTDEPFGPILPLVTYDDLDAAIEAANSLPVGLAGYVVGTDLTLAQRVARRLEVGMVAINSYGLAAAEVPFGGIKQSGFGLESGIEGIVEYLVTRVVSVPC